MKKNLILSAELMKKTFHLNQYALYFICRFCTVWEGYENKEKRNYGHQKVW